MQPGALLVPHAKGAKDSRPVFRALFRCGSALGDLCRSQVPNVPGLDTSIGTAVQSCMGEVDLFHNAVYGQAGLQVRRQKTVLPKGAVLEMGIGKRRPQKSRVLDITGVKLTAV